MELLTEPLFWPIVFPMLAGLVCLLLPRAFDTVRAAVAAGSTLLMVVVVWPIFRAGSGTLDCCSWISLRLDALSSFVLLAIAVFGLLVTLYSIGYMAGHKRQRTYYSCLLLTIGCACGAVLANDLVLLLVFWGILGLTLYLMVGLGGTRAAGAAKKCFVIVGGSDCFLVLGAGILWSLTGTSRLDGISVALSGELSYVAFACVALAAFAKAGAMPLHTWVPDCGEKAPVPVTALLPASLDKLLGIYLLARATMDMFQMNAAMNSVLMFAGAATILCAVMMALVQHDLKRLLAYHAVSQAGYMVLGIGTGTLVGVAGALFHMLNHTIYKTALFMSAGAVEKRTGTTDLDRLGGLARVMPLTFLSTFVAALAISGVPPLNGFTSKWMVYQGVLETVREGAGLSVIWLAAAMLGSALTLASFVKVLHAVFLRKPPVEPVVEKTSGGPFLDWPPLILAALCLVFGVFAFRLPLATMIYPAVGRVDITPWGAGISTLLLVCAGLLGLLIYALTKVGKARECPTYIGGEIMDETYISGETSGRDRDVEVSGVDFYRTLENMPPLSGIYRAARAGLFDLYVVGRDTLLYFVELLRAAHPGLLPLYLTWMLAGFLALLWLLVYGAGIV